MKPNPKLLLVLLTFGVVLVTGFKSTTADYVRPPPRENLQFPWNPKPSSHPQQVHISLAGEKQIRVTWITDDHSAQSVVKYGKQSGKYDSLAEGESTSYSYFLYNSGKIHHTVIGPLEDDTIYYYQCGGEGPEFRFKTPPSKFPITFAVAGDLGQTGWTKSTLDHLDKCKYDVHMIPGDLSYADFIQHKWDTFGELVQPLASTRPWMVTQGNHEKEHIPLITEEFASYNARWKMPYEESGSGSNLYYSFDVAGVHVIMLGSYTDYDESSDQYSWLKADLSKVDREKTPWLIVLFHVPWYNSNEAHQCEGDNMMESMEHLLYSAGVDLVLAGHVHAYERSKRVYGGKSDSCGAVHITIGDGGNREGLAHRYKNPKPEWSVFREASFGHGELKIVNASHAFWTWHRNDDDEPVKSDEVWITSLNGSGCIAERSYELRKILAAP
ncbi:OLC1v1022742C1 [Oldenlandia corymbosa var. corymbosa]|uniref:Purple acid phosphatase n=1 Tax=Oldenlandia corymbosa var. corymbosa TaxID=529605 RepID=A0AAV1C0X2_OLDCO|nr:OLC1v1022742C1 [Oldenlandia corymbosa var. corymbosa]